MTEKIGISLVKTNKPVRNVEDKSFVNINIKKRQPNIISSPRRLAKIEKFPETSSFVKINIKKKINPAPIIKKTIVQKPIVKEEIIEERLPIKVAKPIILKKIVPTPIENKLDRKSYINLANKEIRPISKLKYNMSKEVNPVVTKKKDILRSNMEKKQELLKEMSEPRKFKSVNNLKKQIINKPNPKIEQKSNISMPKINIYLVLILIAFIFVIIAPIFVVNSNWVFSWEIIKTIVFAVGIFLISIFFLLLWALGNIDYDKKFTVYDVTILLFGIGVVILAILNKDTSFLWGNVQRPFDSGIIYLALILFYFILRFFVNNDFVKFVLNLWSVFIILSVTPLILVSSFDIKPIDFLQKLFPSYTLLSSSIIQIAILTIFSLISIWYISYNQKGLTLVFNNIILVIGTFYYIILLQIIQNQTILIISIVISILLFVFDLKENISSKNKYVYKYIIWSFTLLIAILTSVFIKSASFTQEFFLNFGQGFKFIQQSLMDSLIYGKGVSYSWNKFLPNNLINTNMWDTDLFNLWSEIFNFIVRIGSFGLIFLIILILLLGLDILASLFQTKFINKEQVLILALLLILLFFPIELIAKIGVILLFVIYTGKQDFNFPINLWQGKIGLKNYNPQIVSVIGILSFGLIFLNFIFVSNFIKVFQAHNLYETAIASTDETVNIKNITEAKNKFEDYSLYFEYYIQQESKLLDKKLTQIIQNREEDNTQQISDLNQKVKNLLDEISVQKIRYPYSLNIVNSEIDLKFLIKRYGAINDEEILENINLAESLKPSSPKWDFYRSKLYILSYQSEQKPELIDKSIEYIEKSLNKNTSYVLGYELYADIYAIINDNPNQIKVLEKYIEIIQKDKKVADVKLIYRLANLYYQEKEYQLAIELLNVLIRDVPENMDSYMLLSDVYVAEGDIQNAKLTLEKALEKQPELEIIQEKLNNL